MRRLIRCAGLFTMWAAGFVIVGSRQVVTVSADSPVRVDGGLISGTTDAKSGVRVYKGIPFAAPPTGDLRWRPPVPVKAWEGVR